MLTREQKLSLLGAFITVSVTGIGFAIGGTLGASIIGGVGINLSSTLIEGGCLTLKERWVNSRNGVLNHDIQRVLIDALIKSLNSLQKQYVASEEIKSLKRYEKQSIAELFNDLERSARDRSVLASIARFRP